MLGKDIEINTLEEVRKKIEGAYHDRDDYPPFEIASFKDRPVYHRYLLKIIQELIDSSSNENKNEGDKIE